jgi:hypothetical protein
MSCIAKTSAVDRQTLAPGGRSWVERSMTKSDQFREYAEEALQWSRQSKTEEEKKTLLDLAVTWTQAASLSERNAVGPPQQRAP